MMFGRSGGVFPANGETGFSGPAGGGVGCPHALSPAAAKTEETPEIHSRRDMRVFMMVVSSSLGLTSATRGYRLDVAQCFEFLLNAVIGFHPLRFAERNAQSVVPRNFSVKQCD